MSLKTNSSLTKAITITTRGINHQLFRMGYECRTWSGWFLSSFPRPCLCDKSIFSVTCQCFPLKNSQLNNWARQGYNNKLGIKWFYSYCSFRFPSLDYILTSYLFIFNWKGFVFMWLIWLVSHFREKRTSFSCWLKYISLVLRRYGSAVGPESKALWQMYRAWPFSGEKACVLTQWPEKMLYQQEAAERDFSLLVSGGNVSRCPGEGSWVQRCSGLNCIPPEFIYWSPNSQYVEMWLYLKIRSLEW